MLTCMDSGVPLIAHRLGRVPGPDSSRVTLQATLAQPVGGLETDVCLTADGRVVLLHDPWLSAGTNAGGWVHETDWSDVRTARLRDRQGTITSQTPMLLEELLLRAPDELLIQIEIKAHGDAALARRTAAAACRIAAECRRAHTVEIISFFTAACEEAAELGFAARLVVWADYEPEALVAWAARHGVRGVCIEHFLLRAELIARLRIGGLSVTTGTINDAALARRVIALGVDAITTDDPVTLRRDLTTLALAA